MCRLYRLVGLGGTKKRRCRSGLLVATTYHLHCIYSLKCFVCLFIELKWEKRKESNSQVLFLSLNLLRCLDILGSLILKCM